MYLYFVRVAQKCLCFRPKCFIFCCQKNFVCSLLSENEKKNYSNLKKNASPKYSIFYHVCNISKSAKCVHFHFIQGRSGQTLAFTLTKGAYL